jgi:hypothetical protein
MKWHENRHKQQFNIVDCNGLYKLLNRLEFKMASFKRYNRVVYTSHSLSGATGFESSLTLFGKYYLKRILKHLIILCFGIYFLCLRNMLLSLKNMIMYLDRVLKYLLMLFQ